MRRAVAAFARSEGAFPAAYSRMLVSTKAAAIDFFSVQATDGFSFTASIPRREEFAEPLVVFGPQFFILALHVFTLTVRP